MLHNEQWIYARQPQGVVGPEHYQLRTQMLDQHLHRGEVLLRAQWISVDPYMRINQSHGETWMPPHPLGTVQSAAAVAEVLDSADPGFAEGDFVLAPMGWQRYAKLQGGALHRIDPNLTSKQNYRHYLGALGMPGRTAWFGLIELATPRPGDVVVVSGAAGAVGSLVVQLALQGGARVLAIAGTAEKCLWLQRLGAHWTLNYRNYADASALRADLVAKVGAVDVYFDNVGGMVSDAVLSALQLRARVIVCGQMSQYSGGLDVPEQAPRFLHHVLYQRARIEGVLARDYAHRHGEMLARIAPMVERGQLQLRDTIVEGFAQLPSALCGLFSGDGVGKVIVQVEAIS